jgi:hypothetical protein
MAARRAAAQRAATCRAKVDRYGEGIVRRWKESGQSAREYCRAEGLRESAYYFWRHALSGIAKKGPRKVSNWHLAIQDKSSKDHRQFLWPGIVAQPRLSTRRQQGSQRLGLC